MKQGLLHLSSKLILYILTHADKSVLDKLVMVKKR